jgi:hypothetical protein
MKLNLRRLLFIALIVAGAGMGTVGIHASTDCQRLFRVYTESLAKHVHHNVSAATVALWAAWNKAHPHYHPRPTMKESSAIIDFACQLPRDESTTMQPLPPLALPSLLSLMTDPTTTTTPSQPNLTMISVIPPDVPTGSPTGDQEYPPVYYPDSPIPFDGGYYPEPPTTTALSALPPESPVPEPTSLILMTTDLGFLLCIGGYRVSRSRRRFCESP